MSRFEFPQCDVATKFLKIRFPGGEGELLGLIFAGHVPLASQGPFPVAVCSVANYRPQVSHFWANM